MVKFNVPTKVPIYKRDIKLISTVEMPEEDMRIKFNRPIIITSGGRVIKLIVPIREF